MLNRHALRSHLSLLSTLALLASCGVDQTAGGPTVGGAAGDVTQSADAGTAEDAMGDTGGGGVCGDGTCDAAESPATCPLDCKTQPLTGPLACLKAKCPAQMTACDADSACVTFAQCVGKCDGLACVQGCLQQGGEPGKPVKRLLQCGSTGACFEAVKPTCGDGACDPSESAASCPQDCAKPVVCGNGKCELGETLDSCPKDCGSTGPVCGDGKCEGPSENAKTCPKDCQPSDDSCVGKCGKFSGNDQCACDKQCSQFGDCCKDFKEVCGGGDPVCGDGSCDEGESAKSCPKDCSDVDPVSCAKAKCPKEYAQCMSAPACSKLVSCFDKCKPNDSSCYETCAKATGSQPPKGFEALADCAEKQGCSGGDPDPVCGDGSCDDGEEKSCPKDCQPPKPVCGNGQCEAGESAVSCPKDCQQTKPVCGDGKCQGPQENQLTCPKDCGGIQDLLACAKDKCSDSYKKCAADKACSKALECMGGCKNTSCLQSCAFKNQSAWQTFSPLAQCAQQKGCLNGGSTGPTCGNGQCEAGETAQSCPNDCGGSVCGNGKCEPGESAQSCPKDCGGPSNKCGDGKCQFPEEDPKSCPSDCKADALTCKGSNCNGQGKGGCWCDNVCEKAGDCCPDKVAVCGSNSPVCGNGKCEEGESNQSCPKDCKQSQPVCGDGVCTAPMETASTCPKDCGQSTKPCAKKSDCSESEVCCGKAGGNVCVPAGQCN